MGKLYTHCQCSERRADYCKISTQEKINFFFLVIKSGTITHPHLFHFLCIKPLSLNNYISNYWMQNLWQCLHAHHIRVVSSDAEITNWLSCVKHVLYTAPPWPRSVMHSFSCDPTDLWGLAHQINVSKVEKQHHQLQDRNTFCLWLVTQINVKHCSEIFI